MRTELVGTHGQQATACPDSGVAYINHPGAAIVHRRLISQPALLSAQLLAAAVMSSVARRGSSIGMLAVCLSAYAIVHGTGVVYIGHSAVGACGGLLTISTAQCGTDSLGNRMSGASLGQVRS